MKKLSKILLLVLSLAVLVGAFVFAASAEDAKPVSVNGVSYETFEEALAAASGENPTITFTGAYETSQSLAITKNVTIDLGGQTITTPDMFLNISQGVTVTLTGSGTVNASTFADYTTANLIIKCSDLKANLSSATTAINVGSGSVLSLSGSITFSDTQTAHTYILINENAMLDMNDSSVKALNKTYFDETNSSTSAANLIQLAGYQPSITVKNTDLFIERGVVLNLNYTSTEKTYITFENCSIVSVGVDDEVEWGSGFYCCALTSMNVPAEITYKNCEIVGKGRLFQGGSGSPSSVPKTLLVLEDSNVNLCNQINKWVAMFESISAYVNGGQLNFLNDSTVGLRTRKWDSETRSGIFFAAGTSFNRSMSSAAATEGEFYDTANEKANIFSVEGEAEGNPYSFKSFNTLNADHSLSSAYVLSPATGISAVRYISPAAKFSSNFEDCLDFFLSAPENKYTVGGAPSAGIEVGLTSNTENRRFGTLSLGTLGENQYIKFEHLLGGDLSGVDTPYLGLYLGSNPSIKSGAIVTNAAYPMIDYDFVTLDFDLASNTANQNGTASYPDINFNMMARYANPTTSGSTTTYSLAQFGGSGIITLRYYNAGVVSADSPAGHYLKIGNTYYMLPEELGVWTHFTLVFEISNSGTSGAYTLSNTKMHLYANGEYIATSSSVLTTATDTLSDTDIKQVTFDSVRLNIIKPTVDKNIGFSIDNTSTSYYGKGYAGDLVNVKADPTASISGYDEMVYSYSYLFSEPNVPVATVDGRDFFDINGALSAIKQGSVVVLNSDIEKILNPTCAFTVDTKANQFGFKVKSSTYSVIETVQGSGVYTVAPAAQTIPVIFDVDNVLGLDLDQIEIEAAQGTVPNIPEVPEVMEIDGGYYKLLGWSYDGETVETELLTVSKAAIAEGELCIYPVIGKADIEYTITDKSGNVSVYSTFAEFMDNVEAASDGATVKLYSDFVDNTNNWIEFNTAKSINIDLNGNCIKRSAVNGSPVMFKIAANGVEFNLYSSKPGATVYYNNYNTTTGAVSGYSFIETLNSPSNIKVNLGAYVGGEKVPEYKDNLSIYSTVIVNVMNGTGNEINVYGGTYVRPTGGSYGNFVTRSECDIRIEDAYLHSAANDIVGMDGRAQYNAAGTVVIDNCTIVLTNNGSVGTCLSTYTMNVTNCDIIGNAAYTAMTLGAGNRLALNTIGSSVKFGASKIKANESASVSVKTVNVAYTEAGELIPESLTPVITTQDVVYKLYTGAAEDFDNVATVNWMNSDGSVYLTEYYMVGLTAENDGSGLTLPDSGNDWYSNGFSAWAEDLAITEAKTYNFTPKFEGVAANIKGVKSNLTVYSYYQLNVYIPIHSAPENVTDIKVYSDAALTTPLAAYRTTSVLIKGDEYINVISWPGFSAVTQLHTYYVGFKVDGVTVSQAVTASIPDYYARAMEQFDDVKSRTLIMNLVDYAQTSLVMRGNSENETFKTLLETYASYVTDFDTLSFSNAETGVDISNLRAYISGASYEYAAYEPRFHFTPASDTVTSTYTFKVTYTNADGSKMTTSCVIDSTTGNIMSHNLILNSMNKPFTISVYEGKTLVAEGTYSFAAYYNSLGEDSNFLEISEAFYAAAVAAEAYLK